MIDSYNMLKTRGKMMSRGIAILICVLGVVMLFAMKASVSAAGTENTASSDTGITNEVWETYTPEITNAPKSIKAAKKLKLTTNALEGVKVSYSVSDNKYASIDDEGVLEGKRVGTVKVTVSFTATVDGSSKTKKVTCNIKIEGKKKIYIDPGHQSKANGGKEPVGPGSKTKKAKVTGGCQGVATKIPEYKFTLTVAKKLKTALMDKGYDVVMSRTKNNVNISNVQRAKKGNKSGADICIRIHADSTNSSSVRGASVLYPSASNPYPIKKQAKKSKKLAKNLLKQYCKATGIKSRGIVVRNDLSGTNWSTIPTALIECGFMSNAKEDKLINSSGMQKKMVKGMVAGIDKYFGY